MPRIVCGIAEGLGILGMPTGVPLALPSVLDGGVYVLCTTCIMPCPWYGMLRVVWDRGMPPGVPGALPSGLDGGMYVTSGGRVAALVCDGHDGHPGASC